MEKIKTINELEKDYYRFVQVYIKEEPSPRDDSQRDDTGVPSGEPYLRFGSLDHNGIFVNFLKEFNLEAEWECKSCGHYKKETENYNWIGSGIAKREEGKLFLYGATLFHEVNKEHAEKISKLTGLEIIVQE